MPDKSLNSKKSDAELLKEAAEYEKMAKTKREEANHREYNKSNTLEKIINPEAVMGSDEREADRLRDDANNYERRARGYRDELARRKEEREDEMLNAFDESANQNEPTAPIESVLDDIGQASYKKKSPALTAAKIVLPIAIGTVLVAGAVNYFYDFGDKVKEGKIAQTKTETTWTIGENGAAILTNQTAEKKAAPAAPVKNSDSSVSLGDQIYYIVTSLDPAKDTGNEVCAAAGKSCVGYTDLSTTVCQTFHPGALVSSDWDGSSAGFYCNGAPQGGVCAKESNTCHICPQCNINMDCATEIGVLYRETFVECE